MKRAASPLPNPSKQFKLNRIDPDALHLDNAAEQDPGDMSHHGVDQTKCISGSFQMLRTYPERKIEAIVCITYPSAEKHILKLVFELDNKYLPILDFRPLDQFRLSLRGAELRNLPSIPPTCTLPFSLIFYGGLHIAWTHRGLDSKPKTLNTWQASGSVETDGSDWYDGDGQGEVSTPERLPNPTQSKEVAEAPLNRGEEIDLKITRASKRKMKAEVKRLKREALQHADLEIDVAARQPSFSGSNEQPQANSSSKPESASAPKTEAIAKIRTSFRSGSEYYIPIEEARNRLSRYLHLAGIVVDVSEAKRTRNGDWSCHIQIVDESNFNTSYDVYGYHRGFKVTCFTKRHKEWLPQPERGDVVLLRDIKIAEFNGNISGVGYHNKLRWAVYSPARRAIHHGEINLAPKMEGLGPGGSGVPFSPFVDPEPVEVKLCVQISQWWGEVIRSAGNDSAILVQSTEKPFQPTQRVHRLISEAGPNVAPGGYFDCTIEVLRVYTVSDSVRILFATDYTRQEGMTGGQDNSWPPSLSEYVLRFEMWDAAAQIAKHMMPGEFYLINNARMKLTPNGEIEAKVVQSKIVPLKKEDADNNVHLKGLLERREVLNVKESKSDQDICYELIQNVKEGIFFNCTVQLLHASWKPHQTPYIYVTDYTANPRLEAVDEPWSSGLEGCIVKISLSDEQKHIAESATVGGYYAIRKLRLKHSIAEDCFRGILGGHEKLVTGLNPSRIDNEYLNGLLRRKEQWTQLRKQHAKEEARQALSSSKKIGPYRSIRDMSPSNWDVRRCQLIARVVDFYPLSLRDAFYQRCALCGVTIPDTRRACLKCEDYDREHVQFVYQMYILVQDEDGEQVKVSINDLSPLLDGLRRAHLRDDQAAFQDFHAKISPLLGNLEEMHEELLAGKTVRYNATGPLFSLDMKTWVVVPESARAFSLDRYVRIP